MSCGHCGATAQRGRFCTGCGVRMPLPLQPMGPVRRITRRPDYEPVGASTGSGVAGGAASVSRMP
jgi:hypothetical protein